MREYNEISEEWLREAGFVDNPDKTPPWRKDFDPRYKITMSLVLMGHNLGIWIDVESGGMWMGGTFHKEKSHLCIFHESPPPSQWVIASLAKGFLRKEIGPTCSIERCLQQHEINTIMARKVLTEAVKAYDSKSTGMSSEIDPAQELYWNNIKKLVKHL